MDYQEIKIQDKLENLGKLYTIYTCTVYRHCISCYTLCNKGAYMMYTMGILSIC